MAEQLRPEVVGYCTGTGPCVHRVLSELARQKTVYFVELQAALAAERQAREQAERERDTSWVCLFEAVKFMLRKLEHVTTGNLPHTVGQMKAYLYGIELMENDPRRKEIYQRFRETSYDSVRDRKKDLAAALARVAELESELAIIRRCHGPCDPLSPPGLTLEQTEVRTVRSKP